MVGEGAVQVDLERVKYLVREAARLQPGRPALRMGLRAALAVAAPMLVASQIGALVATWATLGGFGVVLVDKGGAYRTRATAMIAAALGGGLGTLAGTLAADSSATLAVIALGTGVCAMAATWQGPAVAVGNTIAVQLIVATTLPHDPARPWIPAVGFVAGGAWTCVLALVLWPVRVYRPARLAAARCLRELARHATEIARRDEDADPAAWRDAVTRRHRAIRETLEAARGVLAATRRGRRGEIGRGERLLVIVEAMDQVFGVLIGVEEVIDHLSAAARAAVTADLRTGLVAGAARLDEIADRVAVEDALPPLPPLAWTAAGAGARSAELAALDRAEVDHAVSLVLRIHEDVAAVAAVVDSLADERERVPIARPSGPIAALRAVDDAGVVTEGDADPDADDDAGSGHLLGFVLWLDALRGSLTRDSLVLRHASRVALVALVSVIATRALGLQRGYWATLTAVLLLQPYLPATLTRGVQRVTGTIAGGLLATAIAALVHDPLGIGLAAIGFAAVSAAVLQLNYGLYALFLTPTFVLLAEVHARDTHLVEIRIANTLLGAGLAVAGALLVWPSRESTRTADRIADAVAGAAGYARQVFDAVAGHAPARSAPVVEARRRAGRAFNHAELSLDRLVAEGAPAAAVEPRMTLITMTRRLAATLSAFGTARHVADPSEAGTVVAAIGVDIERFLTGAAAALRGDGPVPSYPRHGAAAAALPGLLAARIARVDLQASIIAEAVARTAAVA
ncbi:MAG TPA: FUSC family protein [Kofleriaceae bacterium]|nr:FUSC family protein [Kofleriaceae bacterium]